MTLVDRELAARVLDRALARGGDMAELYAEARRGFALSLDDGRVERPQGGRERGACVRVVQGESTYYGHVDGLAEEDLLRVAESVSEAVRGDARHPAALSAAAPGTQHPVRVHPEDVEAARKADLLRACDERARAAGPEVTQARIGYAESRREVEVFGLGRAARRWTTAPACGSAPRSWRGATAAWRPAATRAAATPAGSCSRSDPEAVADRAARRALTLLDAVDAPTGRLPVVVGNGFGGVLLHEAVGHGLEADAVQKRRERVRRPARRPARRAVRDRLRRRQPPERVGQRRDRRRGHADAPDDRDRGRAAHLLPLRPAAGAQGRRGVDRQRAPRVVPPPADPAHDEHLLRAGRRDARTT